MPNENEDYELRAEYDFSKMTIVTKGRYALQRRADVVQASPTIVLNDKGEDQTEAK
jgi:hypothetical protein